jgi:glycosyltransferase involved in cell wall biosynthesis
MECADQFIGLKKYESFKMTNKKISIIIPAYNEEITIKNVILDFHQQFPDADIYVIDNNSKDDTKKIVLDLIESSQSKLHYLFEGVQGKGSAIRTAIRNINSDIYVMVDADETYHAQDLHKMLEIFENTQADMLVGDRISTGDYQKENKRKFHAFGNNLVRNLINFYFKSKLNDIMTGYRVFSRKFIKNYALIYDGFEIETDMTIHALDKKLKIIEHPVKYSDRPLGSNSKLSTIKDGVKVLWTIFNLIRYYKPLSFFIFFSFTILLIALLFGSIPINEYIKTGYITRIPLAILSSSMVLLSMQLFISGLILDAIARGNRIAFEREWTKSNQ